MAFSFTKFLKGLTIREENTTVPKEIDIVPGGNSATKTTITTSQTADRTITMPDATTTVVGTDVSQTLTNKTIDADNNTISNIENDNIKVGASIDATKIADGTVSNTEFQYLDGVNSPIQGQLDNKADISTAVTLNGAQTLTNKTIDADNNTITNIDNNEIKALAGIDATKIADGSVENAEFQYLNGVTSGIQGQLDAKASTASLTAHTGASSGVHGVTGNVVGTTDTQTLTNKTLTAPTIADFTNATHNHQNAAGGGQISLTAAVTGTLPIANGGTGQTTQTNAFDALAPTTTKGDVIVHNGTDNVRQAIGTDGQVLVADSAQTNGLKWSNISGIKNYILNEGAESNVSGWIAYADAAASRPVDGTGGTPNVTITRTTSVPLRGVGSFLLTKDAANRQGQGVSYDFTIDNADQAKVLNISFDWEVGSGTYSGGSSSTDSDVIVYIYDVTNARLIEPAPIKLDGAVIGTEYKYVGSFQTASNSTNYRLILHCATTSASAYTIKFDNVVVGPSVVTTGAFVGEWQTYTPTLTSSGGGNITLNATGQVAPNGKWRRVGDAVEIKASFRNGSGGSATGNAGTVTISLPSGLVADTTKIETGLGTSGLVGHAYQITSNFSDAQSVATNGTTGLAVLRGGAGGAYQVSDVVASFGLDISVVVPVTGWGTSQVLSSETDTRVVAASALGNPSGSPALSAFTTIAFSTTLRDTHGAYNSSTGEFKAPFSGFYRVSASSEISATWGAGNAMLIQVFINGVGQNPLIANRVIAAAGTTTIPTTLTGNVFLNAGDILTIRANPSGATGTPLWAASTQGQYFYIERISGPSQIAASESVNCRAYLSANQTGIGPNNSAVKINLNLKEFDSHNAFDTSAFRYNIPVSGVYKVDTTVVTAGTNTLANLYITYLNKNGASVGTGQGIYLGTATQAIYQHSTFLIKCVAGDYLEMFLYGQGNNSASTLTAISGITGCTMSISRVGN